jgi:hypothetical protein
MWMQNWKVRLLMLVPAVAAAQTTGTVPAHHDSVEAHNTALGAPTAFASAKYTLGFSVTGNNLSNHFNALAVHANIIADPINGIFFGNYPRRFRADFDVIF